MAHKTKSAASGSQARPAPGKQTQSHSQTHSQTQTRQETKQDHTKKPKPNHVDAEAPVSPLDALVAEKSGWKTAAEVAVPAIGWSALAGALVWSLKSMMQPSEPPNWKEAKAELLRLGFDAEDNFEDDLVLFVLFRDLVFSCHAKAQRSIDLCSLAFQRTESLLKLESSLKNDVRVVPRNSDATRAEKLGAEAVFFVNKVEHGPSQKQFILYERAKKRLTDSIFRHVFAVQCRVQCT
jgi:hypothetical protein